MVRQSYCRAILAIDSASDKTPVDVSPWTKETIFIEDIAKNLEPAKELGMKTVWLINDEYWGKKDSDKDFIDLKIKNLSSFLKEINILKVA